MKICFLGDASHTNTQTWVNYFTNELGHDVHVITFSQVESLTNKVKIYRLCGPRTKTFLRYILCIPELKKVICAISPDILIGYRITSYGFMAASTRFHPLVLATQGQNIAYNASKVKACFSKYAIKRADLIHSWGKHMTRKLIEFGADPKKIFTLPRGIDTNLFVPCTRRLSDIQNYKLITTRGLSQDYNHDQILNAISILAKSKKNFKFIFVGDGLYKARLAQRVNKLRIESYVDFVGRVDYSDVPTYLKVADIYISTVPTDGVSASLLEAMACGIFPILINNAANKLWIKDGVNGYLVNCGDHEELARKIRSALENSEYRRKATEMNRKFVVEKASIANNMKSFENAWTKLTQT